MTFTDTTRPTENRTLHFDLSHAESDRVFTLHACLKEYSLNKHTPETLRKARAQRPFLALIPDERITHFIEDLPLPSDAVALVNVTSQQLVDGHSRSRIETMHIHIPRAGRRRAREKMREKRARRSGTPDEVPSVPPKLVPFGVTVESFTASVSTDEASDDPMYPEEIDNYQDAYETACALLFHHRDLMNLNPDNDGYYAAWIMDNCIELNPGISDLALQIYFSALDGGWSTEVPVLDQEGQQMVGDDGAPIYSQKLVEAVQSAMAGPVQWAVKRAKQAPELEGQSWTVQYGVPAADYDATSTTAAASSPAAQSNPEAQTMSAATAAAVTAPYKWTLNNLTPSHGLTVKSSSLKYTPPPTTDTWTATNIWSDHDEGFPLTPDLADQLLAGELIVKIVSADHSQGLVGSILTPFIVDENEVVDFGDVTMSGDQLSPPVETQALAAGTFSLNASRSGLSFQITLTGCDDETSMTVSFCDQTGSVVSPPFVITNMSGYGNLSIDCTNHWLRHLSAYVQFLDDATPPNVITPSPWDDLVPSWVRGLFQPNDSKKFMAMVPPVSVICGIPIKAFPTTLEIPVPDNVHTVRLLWGGLGTGRYDADICSVGIGLTVAIELALPVFFLAAGAAPTDTKQLNSLLEDSATMFRVCQVADSAIAGCVDETMSEQDAEKMLITLADTLGPLLLDTPLKGFISKVLAESTVEKIIPYVDLALQTFNVGVDMAMLEQTTNEVLQSPFYYETDISKSVDLSITMVPDPAFKFFPPLATHYEVKVLYASDASYPVFDDDYQMGGTTQSDPVTVTFSGAPAGGQLKVYAMFYADNGWVAGKGETAWIEAKGNAANPDGSPVLKIENLVVKNSEVPLDASSVYKHKQKLSYQKFDAQGHPSPNGTFQHGWLASPAPTATRESPPPKEGHSLIRLRGLTLAQSPTQLAYAWEASGLHVPVDSPENPISDASVTTLQNITILQRPQEAYAVPEVGFRGPANVAYDISSSDDGSGMNFFIDTTSGNGYHLRRLSLEVPPPDKDGVYHPQPPSFETSTNESWGCFQLDNDRYIYHPKGYVIGISMDLSKLEILKIPDLPSADDEAPRATLASGESGTDARYGLIYGPVALGASLDGRLLVLESLNNRVQAFDVDGVPVACFRITDQNPPPPDITPDPSGFQSTMALIDEKDSVKYLDLAVESKGYIYILSYRDDGSQALQYKVDIYNPDGSFLVTTPGVAAGAITVDLLRDLYTLNYEVILGENDRTEPSVSMWIPPAPGTTQNLSLSVRRSALDSVRRR